MKVFLRFPAIQPNTEEAEAHNNIRSEIILQYLLSAYARRRATTAGEQISSVGLLAPQGDLTPVTRVVLAYDTTALVALPDDELYTSVSWYGSAIKCVLIGIILTRSDII